MIYLMTIANFVSAQIIVGGFSKVYPEPSNLPLIAGIIIFPKSSPNYNNT